MMKKCKACGQLNVRERNGIAISKWCTSCKKQKELEKKEKHSHTQVHQKKVKKATTNQCEKLWREAVKKVYGDKCAVGFDCKGNINCHHVIGRRNKSTRWYVPNGVPLCSKHHVFDIFSAHQNPIWFDSIMVKLRGEKWKEDLHWKSLEFWDKDIDAVKEYLLLITSK